MTEIHMYWHFKDNTFFGGGGGYGSEVGIPCVSSIFLKPLFQWVFLSAVKK